MAVVFRINDVYFREISNGGCPWKTGDWLINYSAGFVRRGLAGELIYDVSSFLNLNLIWLTAILQSLVLSTVYFLAIRLYFRSKRTLTELAILFSPAFLLFSFNDSGVEIRKENLVFLTFLVFLHFLLSRKITARGSFLVVLLYMFSAFSHELTAFCLPFFLAVSYLFYRIEAISKRHLIYLYISFTLVASLSVIIALLFSGFGKSEIICNSLLIHNVPKLTCDGAIAALEKTSSDGSSHVAKLIDGKNYFLVYAESIILASIPFFYFDFSKIGRWKINIFFMASTVAILPLFFTAIDWGRWLHIYIFLISTLVLALTSINYVTVKYNWPLIIVICYATFWGMPHCCSDHIKGPIGKFSIYMEDALFNQRATLRK